MADSNHPELDHLIYDGMATPKGGSVRPTGHQLGQRNNDPSPENEQWHDVKTSPAADTNQDVVPTTTKQDDN